MAYNETAPLQEKVAFIQNSLQENDKIIEYIFYLKKKFLYFLFLKVKQYK